MDTAVTIADVAQIITLIIIVVALFLQYRSIPAKQVDELIAVLKLQAIKTPTDMDDRLLELIEMFRGQWAPTNTVTVEDVDTGVTSTYPVELHVDLSKPSLEQIANEAYGDTDGTNMTADWLDAMNEEVKKNSGL